MSKATSAADLAIGLFFPCPSPASRLKVAVGPECVDFTVIRCRRPIGRHFFADRRHSPQIGYERNDVLFVEIGEVIPRHALPKEQPATAAYTATYCAGDLGISPAAQSSLFVWAHSVSNEL